MYQGNKARPAGGQRKHHPIRHCPLVPLHHGGALVGRPGLGPVAPMRRARTTGWPRPRWRSPIVRPRPRPAPASNARCGLLCRRPWPTGSRASVQHNPGVTSGRTWPGNRSRPLRTPQGKSAACDPPTPCRAASSTRSDTPRARTCGSRAPCAPKPQTLRLSVGTSLRLGAGPRLAKPRRPLAGPGRS